MRRGYDSHVLDDDVKRLATGPYLAAVSTLMPGGQPQTLFTWIDCDDDNLLVNTEPQRQRVRNVARDPRITILIGGESPGDWVEVRGRVVETIDGQVARDHIDHLSRRYVGTDYRRPIGPDGRIILCVAPDRINRPRQ